MARSAYARDSWSGNSPQTTVSGTLTSGSISLNLASGGGTNLPASNFWAVIAEDTANEEHVFVATRTGDALSGIERGLESTTDRTHDANATFRHFIPKTFVDEANYAVNETVGKITTTGDLLLADGANSLARLAIGAADRVLGSNGTTASWRQVALADMSANSVDSDQYVDGSIDSVHLADGIVTPAKLALGAQTNTVATNESTTSGTYTNLTTSGPEITLTVPSTGIVLVVCSAFITAPVAGADAFMDFALSSGNTRSASDTTALIHRRSSNTASAGIGASRTNLLTGLTPGSTVFTAKYKSDGTNVSQFANRSIVVIPIG